MTVYTVEKCRANLFRKHTVFHEIKMVYDNMHDAMEFVNEQMNKIDKCIQKGWEFTVIGFTIYMSELSTNIDDIKPVKCIYKLPVSEEILSRYFELYKTDF
jgi:hypothetical protein